MKATLLTLPDIMLIGGTRVALGAGLGFLLAGKLNEGSRRGAGWALLAIGALSTIPLAMHLVGEAKTT